MKDYISKNWKKILISIGSCALVFILLFKFVAKKTLLNDYIKYGKEIKPTDSEIIDAATDNFSSVWNSVNPELAQIAIIMMVLILLVVALTTLASAAGAKKDAKKK